MAQKRNNTPYNEYRGSDRLFRIDRDTLIVYAGKVADDLRPFLRIGAGKHPPLGLLGNIENVVLPDSSMWNVGYELEWLDVSLHENPESVRYIGSKERIAQLNWYIRGDSEHAISESEQERLNLVPYDPESATVHIPRDRAVTTFLKNGNLQIAVGGTKTLDYALFKRTGYNLDKEYDQLNKILQALKIEEKREGYSFRYAADADDQFLSILWNFNGATMFMNPPQDYHQLLYKWHIYPDSIGNVLSSSPYAPGFIEAIRRKEVIGGEIGIFSPDQEKNSVFKKLYSGVKLNILDDSRSMFGAKEAVFLRSRTGSHGALAIRLPGKRDEHVHIIFPVNSVGKQSRAFDSIKAPHDVEFDVVHEPADLKKEAHAGLRLVASGHIKETAYRRIRMKPGTFPLVNEADYQFVTESDPQSYVNRFLRVIEGSDFHGPLSRLTSLIVAQDVDIKAIMAAIRDVRRLKRPDDLLLRNNVHQFLRFMKYTVVYTKIMSDSDKRVFDALIKRYNPSSLSIGDWLDTSLRNPVFTIIPFAGRDTFLLGMDGPEKPMNIEFPPEVEELDGNEKEYRQYLRRTQKALDKMGIPTGGMNRTMEFMEKLYEQRLDYLEERRRLQGLLDQLEIPGAEVEEARAGIGGKIRSILPAPVLGLGTRAMDFFGSLGLPDPVRNFFMRIGDTVNIVGDFFEDRFDRIGGRKLLWAIPALIVFLLALLIFTSDGSGAKESTPAEDLPPVEETTDEGVRRNGDSAGAGETITETASSEDQSKISVASDEGEVRGAVEKKKGSFPGFSVAITKKTAANPVI